jgi:UDP-N-acetylglucosamine 4,6-dehydratase/5-epimerase
MFKNKTLLITGGTGSFGNAVLNRFLKSDIKEIKIFSRDEKKQDDMRRLYKSKKIKFFVGDVRDPLSIDGAMVNTDYVFHAAALKQVPSCEFFPVEAVKTNIIGTENVLNSAISNKVEKIICLSTDKAVYPINAMGISKAMMEKIFIAKSRNSGKTKIIGTRYGNVMGSRGSVIPLFIEQIKAGKPITITDPKMTRFMMTLDDAVELVLHAFKNGNQGDLFVQKSPAATLSVLAKALVELFKSKSPVKEIGIRHGEKLYETLVTKEEMIKAEDQEKYFKITPDGRDLNYDQYFSQGTVKSSIDEYNSNNTNLLNIEEMKSLLMTLPLVKQEINN